MQEALLQYVWRHALWEMTEFTADTGETIRIHHTGIHNTDAGPDFVQAKIEVDGMMWAGNVEIHVKASDWYTHKHDSDPAYNNVILHAVACNDSVCRNEAGRIVPTIVFTAPAALQEKYHSLVKSEDRIACAAYVNKTDPSHIHFWLGALSLERLVCKAGQVNRILQSTANNWEESFYIQLLISFGSTINALPFELLARSLPLKILRQQPEKRLHSEALLFGQAGFLESDPADSYQAQLRDEYSYLRTKYRLKPIEKHLWKFLRSRPLNFPTIRLAQISSVLCRSRSLFSFITEFQTVKDAVDFFSCNVNEYWKNHYTFGSKSAFSEKNLGRQTLYSILINAVIPFMFLYGEHKNKSVYKGKAISWLEQIRPENNRIVRMWQNLGIHVCNAAESQALIQLTCHYCDNRKCLECRFGYRILKHQHA